jgi:hypothetical protein
MKTPHKLAAVLFADIAGYTAMMADSEDLALKKLTIFKKQLNKALLLNSGQLVQYFGDGALCTFESSAKAIDCAIQLQNGLKKGAAVPVRIGIHTGDVVYKEGNVFGDAVNIASRIESIGKPGAILVSGSVQAQVKGINELEFTSLGKFHFKNIASPIEVYAIASGGFPIPAKDEIEGKIQVDDNNMKSKYKGWLLVSVVLVLGMMYQLFGKDLISSWSLKSTIENITEEGILIFDFHNNTGDSIYDNIQCRINTILSKGLLENNIKVNNHSTLCHNNNYLSVVRSQVGPGSKLEQLAGSKYALGGHLYLQSDSLGIQARIFRTANNEDLFITDPILMHVNDIDNGIIQLTLEILNFWKVKDEPLFVNNLPNRGWLEKYNEAIALVEKDYPRVLELVAECKKIDSNQFRPDFLAMEVYDVHRQTEKIDSLINYLEGKKELLSDAELNLLQYRKALLSFNFRAAYERYLNEYRRDPKNFYLNYSAISYAVQYVNEPEDAIRFGNEIPYEYLDYSECKYCMDRITLLASAKISLEQYDEALEMLDYATVRELEEKDYINALLRIRALVRKKDEIGLNEFLEESKHHDYSGIGFDYFIYWTAREHILVDEMNLAEMFIDKYFEQTETDSTVYTVLKKVELLIGVNKIKEAEALILNYHDQELLMDQDRYIVFKGHIEARQGKTEEVNQKLSELDKQSTYDLKRIVAYYKSQITAGYNNPEESLSYVRESLINGKLFTMWQFQYDPLLKSISNSDRFNDLLNKT